jgi:hypothetical protein
LPVHPLVVEAAVEDIAVRPLRIGWSSIATMR